MERSHPKSAPLAKGLLILRSCLVKIAHFANHLWSFERCLAAAGRPPFYIAQVCTRCWNPYRQQWLDSRRIALRHWRTPMLPWLALTFTAARLGFEAQNAAAFRFMR